MVYFCGLLSLGETEATIGFLDNGLGVGVGKAALGLGMLVTSVSFGVARCSAGGVAVVELDNFERVRLAVVVLVVEYDDCERDRLMEAGEYSWIGGKIFNRLVLPRS